MWVYSLIPPSLSLIGPLTMEIYYRTGITGNTNTQTDTQTETDTFPIQDRVIKEVTRTYRYIYDGKTSHPSISHSCNSLLCIPGHK